MSSQVTLGTSIMISRSAEGWTIFSASSKSTRVTRSWSRMSGGSVCAFMSTFGSTRRSTFIADSLQSAAMSAPTNP
ncbi:MAG: hypothetical protein A4E28_03007 [Methanocella sp. PtaU1.Bin125]|nr:MAG: hypothetical protein A4E28_03007 [Methanocella sp. PtaU1.Bin125]